MCLVDTACRGSEVGHDKAMGTPRAEAINHVVQGAWLGSCTSGLLHLHLHRIVNLFRHTTFPLIITENNLEPSGPWKAIQPSSLPRFYFFPSQT